MKLFILLFLMAGCAHRKSAPPTPNPETPTNSAASLRSLGEIFRAHVQDPQFPLSDALEACAKSACGKESERALATKLISVNQAIRDKNKAQAGVYSIHLDEDLRAQIGAAYTQKENIAAVVYETWFLAGALYPYAKSVSKSLFTEVRKARKVMDAQTPKPDNYYFLVAVENEFQNIRASEKVQAYKKCIDEEPSNKRCQDSYLKWSAADPRAIEKSESNLAKSCRPEIDKAGFALYVGSDQRLGKYNSSKSFSSHKIYLDHDEFLSASEIADLVWHPKDKSITAVLTDAGRSKVNKSIKTLSGKVWVLLKKELIYASAPAPQQSVAHEVRFAKTDHKGLADLVVPCQK